MMDSVTTQLWCKKPASRTQKPKKRRKIDAKATQKAHKESAKEIFWLFFCEISAGSVFGCPVAGCRE
jgi:hypothetical protein